MLEMLKPQTKEKKKSRVRHEVIKTSAAGRCKENGSNVICWSLNDEGNILGCVEVDFNGARKLD